MILTAKLHIPALAVVIVKDKSRLKHAARLAVDGGSILRAEDAMERLDALSGEHGFESVIEAVGCPRRLSCLKCLLPRRIMGRKTSWRSIGSGIIISVSCISPRPSHYELGKPADSHAPLSGHD